MSYLSIRDLDLKGKRVFIRVDFNVPLQKNAQGVMEITSDKRIKASLPTIQYALEQGAGVILASHLGRPKGKPNAGNEPEARGGAPGGAARPSGEDGARLRRPGSRGHEARARRSPAARKSALPRRGREERSRIRPATRRAVRPLRQRCVRFRASRACFHRGHDPLRAAGRRRPAHGAGTEVSRHGHHQSAAPLRRDSGRRQGLRQDRSHPEPGQGRGQAC